MAVCPTSQGKHIWRERVHSWEVLLRMSPTRAREFGFTIQCEACNAYAAKQHTGVLLLMECGADRENMSCLTNATFISLSASANALLNGSCLSALVRLWLWCHATWWIALLVLHVLSSAFPRRCDILVFPSNILCLSDLFLHTASLWLQAMLPLRHSAAHAIALQWCFPIGCPHSAMNSDTLCTGGMRGCLPHDRKGHAKARWSDRAGKG